MFVYSLRFFLSVVLGVVVCTDAFTQELPPVKQFTTQEYKAGHQNWSISQDIHKTIYVANNKGLLEYNGAHWKLYANKNQTIVRSVNVSKNKIFTGSYMDFGFWERNAFGNLSYTSLVAELNIIVLEDEEFWNIFTVENWQVFQSLDRIFIYNTTTNTIKIIKAEAQITKMYKVSNTLYYQCLQKGLYKIENGFSTLISNEKVLIENEIINIFNHNNSLLIHLKYDGFYLFDNQGLAKWNIDANTTLSKVSAYSSIQLKNGGFIIGTISHGVIKVDSSGKIVFTINQGEGLANATVLSLFEDTSGNIWLGLDNGINVLNLDSPYRVYTDLKGKLGTVYTAAKTSDYLYLGTNQGLFYKPLASKQEFSIIKGTEGQVWNLRKISEDLFCCHDSGTFQIIDSLAIKIASERGTWDLKPVPNNPNLILQGNYRGLSVLSKSGDLWSFKHKIDGFNMSSRYFEFINFNTLLINHEYKGVYKIRLNDDYTFVKSSNKEVISKGIGSSLFTYKDSIFYAYNEGVFKYKNKNFQKHQFYSSLFKNFNYESGKFIVDKNTNKLWVFLKDYIAYLEPGRLSSTPIINAINLPSDLRKTKSGYETILALNNNKYLLGTTEGYLVVELNKFKPQAYTITLNKISFSDVDRQNIALNLNAPAVLDNKQNNLEVSFSVPNYNQLYPTQYQYKLNGLYDYWSNWSNQSVLGFKNLPHGEYSLEVRAKVGNNISKNTATFNFKIKKPWYLKPIAILVYVLLFMMLLALIQLFNTKYYKTQKLKLIKAKEQEFAFKEVENERKVIEYKNKALQLDIENKNRELSLSTMNLIRKNEFLNSLKRKLSEITDVNELSNIIKIIEKGINNSEDWKNFEEAFNNADKDFLKKLKTIHPSLTPNDLKLCTYLRLNLSSKEIAPLLNISHRSVEVKRYRLRKKMNLPHEASLTNYILEV